MSKEKEMVFGKKYRVGNYWVLKYTKVLRKNELDELRRNIPIDVRGRLTRTGLPFIKVSTVSGNWCVDYCCNTVMYAILDRLVSSGTEEAIGNMANLFAMMYFDTTVLGDDEYLKAKHAVMEAYIGRIEAPEEDDGEALEAVQRDEELKATFVDMVNELGKGGSDEG